MNNFKLDRDTLIILYKKHKAYIIPIATIVICFILLLEVTIPLIRNLSQRQQEVKSETDKLNILQNNLNILNSMSPETLDKEVTLATGALPVDKNFSGILNAVTVAANKSGVFLGDYDFTVGDLSKTTTIGKNIPFLQLSLIVNGGVNGAIKFVDELYKTLPLSEVSNMQIGSSSVISVSFYYKAYLGGMSVSSALPALSKEDTSNLSTITDWSNGNNLNQIILPLSASKSATASSSANPSIPF